MYQLQFTLKQHTPIIHFQHEQDGATLRATEVKPKLDRFILMKLGNGDYETGKKEADKNGWLIDSNKGALNYKMRISTKGNVTKYFITSNPESRKQDENRNTLIKDVFSATYVNQTQYFGNNKNLSSNKINEKDEVKLGLKSDNIEILITTFNIALNKFISSDNKELLKAFFLLNNFGTRQSKGFGCFLPENIEECEIKKYLNMDSNILGLFKKELKGSFTNKLQEIANDYSLLKRGKTHGGYQKSKLWDYLCSTKKISWEKRAIKLNLLKNNNKLFAELKINSEKIIHQNNANNHHIDFCDNNDNNNAFYIRALLGLAEQYEFVKKDNSRLKVKISDSSPDTNKIDRFKSPIRYVITDYAIYLFAYTITKELQTYKDNNGNFHIRYINFKTSGVPDLQLQIPKDFDIISFIKQKSGYTHLI